jgi:hypothetical protein
MSAIRPEFAAVLLRRQVISPAQLAEARQFQARTGARLADALVRLGHATMQDVMVACAESLGLAFLDLSHVTVPLEIIELVPESVARENVILPVALEGGVLTVALSDPADLDTLQKLEFILNRRVRPVLAPREQIVEAINRHYGQSETESVDSMLAEFTDTAIDFTQTEFELSLEEEEESSAAEPAAARPGPRPLVERRATVRYYHRMNPERTFPLLVVLSRQAIQEVAKRGVSQGQSEAFRIEEGSLVEVEPILPGCACYPPKDLLRVGPGEASVTFWIVPHVLGKVMQARVVVRQGGDTLAEVPLEVRVVKQSLTVLMGGLSVVLPFVLLLLKHFNLDFESQLQDGFGLYAQVARWLLRSLTPELLTGLLLAGTAGLYFWLRPRKRDVFWDVRAAGVPAPSDRAEQPAGSGASPEELFRRARVAFERGDPGEGERLLAALLQAYPLYQPAVLYLADRRYQAGDHAGALPLYESALALGSCGAASFFRASLAAHQAGDSTRALAILQRAEASLPKAQMKAALWYNMGCFAARLGRYPDALRYLNRAVDAGYDDPKKYGSDPDLKPLHWHAGFKRLLADLGC